MLVLEAQFGDMIWDNTYWRETIQKWYMFEEITPNFPYKMLVLEAQFADMTWDNTYWRETIQKWYEPWHDFQQCGILTSVDSDKPL